MCNQDDVWCLELHNSSEFQEDTKHRKTAGVPASSGEITSSFTSSLTFGLSLFLDLLTV